MLTDRGFELLAKMKAAEDAEEYEDAEIVCSGFSCWLGLEKVSRRTVQSMVQHVVVSKRSEPGEAERFSINGTGREALIDPEVPDRVALAILKGQNVDHRGFPLEEKK